MNPDRLMFAGKLLAEKCEVCGGRGVTGETYTKGYQRYSVECPECDKGYVYTKHGRELYEYIRFCAPTRRF